MNIKSCLYGICSILLFVNIALAEPKHSGWPLQVLSWDIDKAYPGIEYNYRLGVRGGEYPYTFSIVTAPSGMTIESHTGTITWTPIGTTLGNVVEVKITDSRGDALKHSFTVDATTNKFYFVASANGSNSNNGSEAHPWLTMAHACSTATATGYVYVKRGTYNESFPIASNMCGRFFAYPGDSVTIIGSSTGTGSFWINGGNKIIFQGFTFDANHIRWLFSVGSGGYAHNIIWRKNVMHNCYSNDLENPAFIFFWNGSGSVGGPTGYQNMIIQDNIFYTLRNINNHGASVTMYDVQHSLYEDNSTYDIDGRGVDDKDMGYMNTIRNNDIHSCSDAGIAMCTQGGEVGEDISYNHIYSCTSGVAFGSQPGYLNNVFVHHNTIIGNLRFGIVLSSTDTACRNINIYKNIFGNGGVYPYLVPQIQIFDTISGNISYHYEYPIFFKNVDTSKVQTDSNIVWSTVAADKIAGNSWGIPPTDWVDWRLRGFDKNSILKQLTLDANYVPILPDSLKIYGRNISSSIKPPVFVQPRVRDSLLIQPNPFSPEKSASESPSLAQKYGNNAPKGTCISFALQSSGAAIQEVNITIENNVGERVAKVNMQKATPMTVYHLWWDGRTTTTSGVNWDGLKAISSDANGREMSGDKMCRNGRYIVFLIVKDSGRNRKPITKQVVLIK